MTTIYFFHGSMSSPQSQKIQHLIPIAQAKGYTVDIPDHSEIRGADDRVEAMLQRDDLAIGDCILVGSSMGGYVATALSEALQPSALFLMAPAFFLMGYELQNPEPYADKVTIVHGWNDIVVPLQNTFKFAKSHKATLHILDDAHDLRASIETIGKLFDMFI